MTVDIVGIENHQISYPDAKDIDFSTLQEYLIIAKKGIRTFANAYRPGLAEEMLRSEDAVANVATAIMWADWRWSPDYRSKTGKVRTRRCYRNQCCIWAIKDYIGRRAHAKQLVSLDKVISNKFDTDTSLHEFIPSKEAEPEAEMVLQEEQAAIQRMLDSSQLTDQQALYIQMYYTENMTLQEIANGAGTSREAVRQTIERGMTKIKKLGVPQWERKVSRKT